MFRFTIRDVLWLMVVVGVAVGWLAEHRRVGNSPWQLDGLIEVLGHHDIQVELQPRSVYVKHHSQDGSWYEQVSER